ncbi:MAG: TetR/AcrR family transcriptional regulator [Treponema sp.]|nr:TetR/AcrR family transcriptional regulator [Treponema sp.]
MTKKKINPSAILSKEWIIESLLDMLAIKPLSSISISEIAENAKVDRRTFYRHFKSKNDVISFFIHNKSKQYEQIILRYNINDVYSFAKAIFETLELIKDTLQILYKQNLLDLFLTDFEIIYGKYQFKYIQPEIIKLENMDYIMTYQMGGFTYIVKKWIVEGCVYSPDKMAKIFEQMYLLIKKNL